MTKILFGCDDAGKGPVLGPMVVAGVIVLEEDMHKLKELGVKDSKLLTGKDRERLYSLILGLVKNYRIIIITPQEIDNAVLSDKTNLNWLEGEKMAELINFLKPDHAIIDCPSTNKKAFDAYIKTKLVVKTELQCEHKGERFIEVAAASILAKVTRDREVQKIQSKIKERIGSGYPSDPLTKEFLKNNWDKYHEIFRHSWATYKVYSEGKNSKKQKKLGEY